MQILLVALSLAVIIGGPKAVGWLLSAAFAPIQWLLRMLIGAGTIALCGYLLLPQTAQQMSSWIPRGLTETAMTWLQGELPEVAPQPQAVLLDYLPLGQLDVSIYSPPSLADQLEQPEQEPVKNLACLAVVYVMLERGRGNSSAIIDQTRWLPGQGAIHPSYVKTTPTNLSVETLVAEIKSQRPVILESPGSASKLPHFVLAVGFTQINDGVFDIAINDPWRGKRVILRAAQGKILDTDLEFTFSKMRTVAGR